MQGGAGERRSKLGEIFTRSWGWSRVNLTSADSRVPDRFLLLLVRKIWMERVGAAVLRIPVVVSLLAEVWLVATSKDVT